MTRNKLHAWLGQYTVRDHVKVLQRLYSGCQDACAREFLQGRKGQAGYDQKVMFIHQVAPSD